MQRKLNTINISFYVQSFNVIGNSNVNVYCIRSLTLSLIRNEVNIEIIRALISYFVSFDIRSAYYRSNILVSPVA